MCKLKSGLLFKNGVFVPDYDSHDKMLTEKGIEDTAENRIAGKFVRFELSPENDDPFFLLICGYLKSIRTNCRSG